MDIVLVIGMHLQTYVSGYSRNTRSDGSCALSPHVKQADDSPPHVLVCRRFLSVCKRVCVYVCVLSVSVLS